MKITAELNGNEILDLFIKQLKSNGIDAEPSQVNIVIKSKENKEVVVTPDRLCITFNKV